MRAAAAAIAAVIIALLLAERASAAPIIWDPTNPRPPTAVNEGEQYRYTMRAIDVGVIGGGPITYAAPMLPPWLAFDGSATIAGTPGQQDAGTHQVVLTASDGTMTIEDRFQILVVAVNAAPVLQGQIGPDPQNAIAGQAYSFGTSGFFSDPDGDALSFTAAGLPPTLAIDGTSGVIGGTPARDDAARSPYTVRVDASDGQLTASDTFQLIVTAPNRPPQLSAPIAPDPQRATVGTPYRLETAGFFTDPDGQPLAFTATGLPPTLAIDAASGAISGTPADADAAASPFNVTVQASDGQAAAADSFLLEVVRPDRPPVLTRPIEPDPQTATEGQAYAFVAAPFFGDPDGDTLSFRAANLPPSFAIDAATGRISGTPSNADIDAKPVTVYTVTVTAFNGGGETSDAFQLRIQNVNQPPTLPDPPPRLGTNEDEPLTITAGALRASDPDGDALTVVVAAPGPDDRFTLAGGGARIVPATDYNGPLTARVRVRDGEAESNTVTVTIAVQPVNDRPRGGPVPPQSATEAVAFELGLAPLFSDVEGDTLTFSARGLPPGLALDQATGVIAGTPPLGTEARDYAVDLSVSDGEDRLDTRFKIGVLRAGRADLAAEIAVAPSPALIATPTTWTLTARNASSTVDVGNVDLTAQFLAAAPFTFDPPANPACTITPSASGTQVRCRVGPLAAGASTAVTLTGSGARAGDVLGTLSVAVADIVPIDETPANDSAFASLHVAEQLSSGPVQTLTLTDSRGAAAGDLDGDGALDLAAASAAGIAVFRGGPDPADAAKRLLGAVPVDLAQPSANAVAAADLDGDGDLDLGVANAAGAANSVLLNGGALAFTAVPLGDEGVEGRAVAIADLDGDTLPEVVFANDGGASVYANRGGGVFERSADLPTAGARDVVLVDLVGDTLPEIVLANGAGDAAVHARAATGFSIALTLPTGPTAAVAAGDFDGNGAADLVFGRDGSGGAVPPNLANPVFLNTSTAAPSFFLTDELGAAPTLDVLAADFDLDGDDDVLAVNATGGHQLYSNSGTASAAFLLHPTQLVASGARAAAAGAIGVDDRIDVVLAGGQGPAVFFNDGRGNLGAGDVDAPTVSIVGEPAVTVTVGDPYNDAGATATDAVDGDLTAGIVVDNPVDTAVVGTYTVTYRVTDSSGNVSAPATRSVEVRARSDTGGGGGGAATPGELLLLLLLRMLWAPPARRERREKT